MIATALAILGALALVAHLATSGLVLARIARARAPLPPLPDPAPRLTLLRPVCGLDPFDAETLGTSFDLDYPDYEVIFCVARAEDPIVPVVRDLIARHPATPAALLIGDTRMTANPKLNNLAKGWDAATGDVVVMADANLLLPRDYLRQLLARQDAGTGLVSSPCVGLRPDGWAAAWECAFLNTNQARLQLAADSLGMGFAQGKTLMWDARFLDAAGGLPALARNIAEDVAATKVVREAGLAVKLPPMPFGQPVGRRTWAAVWARQRRWARIRREGFPALYAAEPLNGIVLPLLAIATAVALGGLPAAVLPAYAALWYGSEWVLARAAGWPHGLRDLLVWPLRDLSLPVLWVAGMTGRGFDWRGTAVAPSSAGIRP